MKALSLWQPWASLIFGQIKPGLFKQWETRSWHTAYRGPLLIHAGAKHFSEHEAKRLFRSMGLWDYFHSWWYMPYGAILGRVELVDCISTKYLFDLHEVTQEQRLLGDFSRDRFAWGLDSPVLFETPIPFRGRQRLFDVDNSFLEGKDMQAVVE